jgi:hypothetical protein
MTVDRIEIWDFFGDIAAPYEVKKWWPRERILYLSI